MARTDIQVTVEDHTNILPKRQVLIIITSLAISLLISYIDQNSITVILPKIGKDLSSIDTIQWAGTSSLIANTVFQVFYGRVSDIFGRNVVLFASLASLAIGDLACGLARTGPQLYVFRAIAGVGNGGINALAMIIVSDIVTLEERGKCVFRPRPPFWPQLRSNPSQPSLKNHLCRCFAVQIRDTS